MHRVYTLLDFSDGAEVGTGERLKGHELGFKAFIARLHTLVDFSDGAEVRAGERLQRHDVENPDVRCAVHTLVDLVDGENIKKGENSLLCHRIYAPEHRYTGPSDLIDTKAADHVLERHEVGMP